MDYPWFQKLESNIEVLQGDFFQDCPIMIPPTGLKQGDSIEMDVLTMDAVVLTQSCDLVNKTVDIVLLCPHFSLNIFFSTLKEDQVKTPKARTRTFENLRKGYLPGYHLLNKQEGIFDEHQVVDFRNVYGIHSQTLFEMARNSNKRVRLLPPYREHLSQAFARYFMRVGLPQDIAAPD